MRKEYYQGISIHAPPRGATVHGQKGRTRRTISIHAPPRGATLFHVVTVRKQRDFNSRPSARGDATWRKSSCSRTYFNSRPSARGDDIDFAVADFSLVISIHAPPRGATTVTVSPGSSPIFQFTPLREGRRQGTHSTVARLTFQFTPLREGRRVLARVRPFPRDFNSRPSARGDQWRGAGRRCNEDFNSRPSARGDSNVREKYGVSGVFQFTPLREGRRARIRSCVFLRGNFNSRPSARGDLALQGLLALALYFNSRPSARGDTPPRTDGTAYIFQFTPLREGRPGGDGKENRDAISIHAPPRGATGRWL